MDAKIQVLEAMQKEGIPLNAGKIVELTNLDRKVVDKAMTELRADELITSPKRCYWQAK
jgi:DNA-binding IscR family transcriptional regulator